MNLKVNDAHNCLYNIMGYMFSGDSPRVFADIWTSKLAKENAAGSSDNSAARVSLDSGTDPITKILGQKKQKVAAENSEAAPTQGGRAGSKVPASVPGSRLAATGCISFCSTNAGGQSWLEGAWARLAAKGSISGCTRGGHLPGWWSSFVRTRLSGTETHGCRHFAITCSKGQRFQHGLRGLQSRESGVGAVALH